MVSESFNSENLNIKENEGFRRADAIINALFPNIDTKQMQDSIALLKSWKEIVGSISSNPNEKNKTGQLLAAHTDVIDLKNGILLVETDHPAYIQMLQIYKNYILRGLKKKYPELDIRMLSFRLKNSDVKLNDAVVMPKENERKKEASQSDVNLEVNKNLPPELQEKFEKLKNLLFSD